MVYVNHLSTARLLFELFINIRIQIQCMILKLLTDKSSLDVLDMDSKLLKLSHSVPAPCIANLVNLSIANGKSESVSYQK